MDDKSYVSMSRCFYCGEFADVLLDTTLRDSLPRDCGVISMRPCSKCESYMQMGVVLIGYDEEKTDMEQVERDRQAWRIAHESCGGNRGISPNTSSGRSYAREMKRGGYHPWEFIPDVYRSGQFAVVKDEFITRNITPEPLAEQVIRMRWSFMPSPIMEQIIGESPTSNEETTD